MKLIRKCFCRISYSSLLQWAASADTINYAEQALEMLVRLFRQYVVKAGTRIVNFFIICVIYVNTIGINLHIILGYKCFFFTDRRCILHIYFIFNLNGKWIQLLPNYCSDLMYPCIATICKSRDLLRSSINYCLISQKCRSEASSEYIFLALTSDIVSIAEWSSFTKAWPETTDITCFDAWKGHNWSWDFLFRRKLPNVWFSMVQRLGLYACP